MWYHNIQYINNPSIEVQLECVKFDGYTIRYIHNPDIKVQLTSVKYDVLTIQYINNPSIEILNEVISVNNLKNLDDLIRYVDIVKYIPRYMGNIVS